MMEEGPLFQEHVMHQPRFVFLQCEMLMLGFRLVVAKALYKVDTMADAVLETVSNLSQAARFYQFLLQCRSPDL